MDEKDGPVRSGPDLGPSRVMKTLEGLLLEGGRRRESSVVSRSGPFANLDGTLSPETVEDGSVVPTGHPFDSHPDHHLPVCPTHPNLLPPSPNYLKDLLLRTGLVLPQLLGSSNILFFGDRLTNRVSLANRSPSTTGSLFTTLDPLPRQHSYPRSN